MIAAASSQPDRAAASSVLVAQELTRRLGRRLVVDRVSLEVGAGEIVGLLGPNGAGKTTVFRLLMGLLRLDAGRVLLAPGGDPGAPREITRAPVHRRAAAGLGYLPQGPSVLGGLSVADNIAAVLELQGRGGPAPRRARALLADFGLEERAGQLARTLSGGERRRLELARLMAASPSVLLLDEPLAGLDPRSMDDLSRRLVGLKNKGLSILLTDHNVHQALTICERAYILVDGGILVSGDTRTITQHTAARRLFWGEDKHGT